MSAKPGKQTAHEWEAFLSLSRVWDLATLDAAVYGRLERACGRLNGKAPVSRKELLLESGLSFFEECAEPDLALMSLVRQGILQPVPFQPFFFTIHAAQAALVSETCEPVAYSSKESSMQQAKLTAEMPSPAPVLLPVGTAPDVPVTTLSELPPEVAERLKQPLPPEAISPHSRIQGLSSVKAIYIVERLNQVFNLNGWEDEYDVVETGPMVVVRGCLRIPKYGIVRQQYGGNDNPDRGDAYKGACTDALSKCASQLGIAIDVYKGCAPGSLRTADATPPIEDSSRIDLQPESDDRRAGRFREMERVLGTNAYLAVFSQNGYAEEPATLEIDNARVVYADLLRLLRRRFEFLRQQVDKSSYRRLLYALRLSANTKLNAEQLIRVFEALWEVIDAQF